MRYQAFNRLADRR